jgi:hypothetical protein
MFNYQLPTTNNLVAKLAHFTAKYLPAYKAAATYVLIKHPIRHHLYICRENSTNQSLLFKTNPIFRKPKMNVTYFTKKDYENVPLRGRRENKPKQTQFQTGHKGANSPTSTGRNNTGGCKGALQRV